jgi:hypothetical protein
MMHSPANVALVRRLAFRSRAALRYAEPQDIGNGVAIIEILERDRAGVVDVDVDVDVDGCPAVSRQISFLKKP